jgi:hypothetical protein
MGYRLYAARASGHFAVVLGRRYRLATNSVTPGQSTMRTHALKALAAADKVLAMAEDSLAGLEMTIAHWPADFRAIIWEAVAGVASRRAENCRKAKGSDNG